MESQIGNLHTSDTITPDTQNIANDRIQNVINMFSVDEQLRFEFNNIFSNRVKERRKSLGWTQDQLAKRSGVNRVTIAKIEMKQRTVSVDVMLKLLNALEMTIQFINL